MIPKRLQNSNALRLRARNSAVQRAAQNEVLENIKTNVYSYVSHSCAVCGETSWGKEQCEIDRYGFDYTVRVCQSCSHWQVEPMLRGQDYQDFYEKYYREIYSSPWSIQEFFEDQILRGLRIYRFLSKRMDLKGIAVVDVGCGAGGVLAPFQNQSNTVTGFDFDLRYLNYGKTRGLDLRVGGLDAVEDESADLIIFSHVLEHIENLDVFLLKAGEKLRKGGRIYVEVPGLFSIWRDYGFDLLKYMQNAHLHHFRKNTLVRVFRNNGFEVIASNEKIRALFVKPDDSNFAGQKTMPSRFLCVYIFVIEIVRPLVWMPYSLLRWCILKFR